MSRSGSPHGYDIIDHNRIDPELGGEEGFRAFVAAVRAEGMGIILDFVPNHMGVGSGNPWWQDVLKNGRCSLYAHYFDIDWDPLKPELKNKLLLPILGAPYGEVLDAGGLRVEVRDGEFQVRYYEHGFPIALDSVPLLLRGIEAAAGLNEELRGLPPHHCATPAEIRERRERTQALEAEVREWLAGAIGGPAAEQAIAAINGRPGDAASFDRLHQLLEAQPYRLAYWRVSGEEINYRRFFDVNDLVGLSQEYPDVFAATHKRLREMLALKQIDGVRIDHLDGLYNPLQYLIRLQMLDIAAQLCGASPCDAVAENGIERDIQKALASSQYSRLTTPLYCLVEKILEPGEHLPEEWPVSGTSGYEFMNLLNGIFIEQSHARRFSSLYQRFTGLTAQVRDLTYESKKLVMDVAMASEVNVLTDMLADISEADRSARDFTQKTMRDAIQETVACFSVYRTYIDERGEYAPRDRAYVEDAIRRGKRRNPGMNAAAFEFLRSVLLLLPPKGASDVNAAVVDYRRKLHFALKFQQLTGPVMAKGLEDTVCYIYNRFVSVNEVGGSPEIFGVTLEDFHAGNRVRAELWPASMLATSTHDTKRGEDVRARLNVLSEIPSAWSARALRWRRINKPHKQTLGDGRVVPDANEEYLLYQTIVGTFPWDFAAQREHYIARIQQYMTKAVHEAKVNLSWINDDPEYVAALETFVAATLSPGKRSESALVADLLSFLPEIAYHGALNSLAQTLLKLTVPGVPDTYRGAEMWDFSLVDPDNRRPVDIAANARALDAISDIDGEPRSRLLARFESGQLKLFLIQRALRLRQEREELFRGGDYAALAVSGERSRHGIAFLRRRAEQSVIVAAPRFTHTLMRGKSSPPIAEIWGDTRIAVPGEGARAYENVFTGERFEIAAEGIALRDLFRSFPFALLRSL